MKFLFVTILLLAASLNSNAQNEENAITIGHIETIYSEVLEEEREIWIHVPKEIGGNIYSDKYPVLYLLDGNAHFASVTGLIQQLTTNGNSLLPKMIIVGIPNTNRWRDLTPTHTDEFESSGGGEAFLDFIENELIQYIDDNYATENHRTFVGHSLGGLTVLNTLLKRPHVFNNYVAIDPSMSWDDQKLLKQYRSKLATTDLENKSLFVGVANTMKDGMDYSTVMSDTNETSLHIRSILEFTSSLENEPDSKLNFGWKYYNDDSHSSVPLITEYDGLRFLYSWYECDCYSEIISRKSKYSGPESIELLKAHFKLVSSKMGYPIIPKEAEMNGVGYWFLEIEQYDKAYSFLNFVIENYPESFNAYDSLGDYYVAIGDNENAIKSFEKSLKLGGLPYTKGKLDYLKDQE